MKACVLLPFTSLYKWFALFHQVGSTEKEENIFNT